MSFLLTDNASVFILKQLNFERSTSRRVYLKKGKSKKKHLVLGRDLLNRSIFHTSQFLFHILYISYHI